MAKSKEQKQKEAIERKRAAFPAEIKMWCEAQEYSTKASNIHKFGKEHCDKHMADAEKRLVRAAKEAHLDRYGNPLPSSENLKQFETMFPLLGVQMQDYQKPVYEFLKNNPKTIIPLN